MMVICIEGMETRQVWTDLWGYLLEWRNACMQLEGQGT